MQVACRAEARAGVVRDADGVGLRRRRRRALDRDRDLRHQPEDRQEHQHKERCFFQQLPRLRRLARRVPLVGALGVVARRRRRLLLRAQQVVGAAEPAEQRLARRGSGRIFPLG